MWLVLQRSIDTKRRAAAHFRIGNPEPDATHESRLAQEKIDSSPVLPFATVRVRLILMHAFVTKSTGRALDSVAFGWMPVEVAQERVSVNGLKQCQSGRRP